MPKARAFTSVQRIPISPSQAWQFFSDPANLPMITPGHLRFKIISGYHGDTMYAGQIIEYTVAPIFGIPLYWMTEITHVEDKIYFIDEQRFGPYRFWHHQHHFKEVEGGVEMTDIVHYKLPLGFLGCMADNLFVKKQLKDIFDFRREAVEKKFGVSLR